MKSIVISLFAESFIHPGSGQDNGAIDLPVARERVTGYPFIAGSSLKGAWRDYARSNNLSKQEQDTLFGEQNQAGQLLISDARLQLLPVRSLNHSYCWLTSPLALERLARDFKRAFHNDHIDLLNITLGTGKFLGHPTNGNLFLEERCFEPAGEINPAIINTLKKLIPNSSAAKRLEKQLVILHDEDYKWFTQNALSIQARNVLDDDTKQSNNLWYEETLPPDTLMVSLTSQRTAQGNALETLVKQIIQCPYLQVGGNETVGQGWFNIHVGAQP